MLTIAIFFTVFSSGAILQSLLYPTKNLLFRLALTYLLGSCISVTILYLLKTFILFNLNASIITLAIINIIVWIYIILSKQYKSLLSIHSSLPEIAGLISLFLYAWFIFSKSFNYSSAKGVFLIATNVYSDFGIHIPFIRSFSLGNNFPAEVPIFAQGHLFYYFMTVFYAGLLEHAGIRIDYAINIVSIFAFVSIAILIYHIAVILFSKKNIGILSVLFFLFPSDLSVLLVRGISSFWHHTNYSISIVPYWNLNAYINQRQLLFGIGITLSLFLFILQNSIKTWWQWIVFSLVLSCLSFWHSLLFVGVLSVLFLIAMMFGKQRKGLVLSMIGSIVIGYLFIHLHQSTSINSIFFNPGFILAGKLSLSSFLTFWVWNLGLVLPLALLSWPFLSTQQRKYFIALLPLFLLPNIFQFSKDIAGGHKFINLWIVCINIYAAYMIVILWKHFSTRILGTCILCIIFLGGIYSFLVIKNDIYTTIVDYPHNQFMQWSLRNLPSNGDIITNGEIYDPISLLGKKIFLGREYYVYSYGANYAQRVTDKAIFLNPKNKEEIIALKKKYDITYIVLYKNNFAKNTFSANNDFYTKSFSILYNDKNGMVIKI